jgi:hypothetical protein
MWMQCKNDRCRYGRSFDVGSGTGGNQKYCCPECRQHAYRERKRLARLASALLLRDLRGSR